MRVKALAGRRTLLMSYAGQGNDTAVGAFMADARADKKGDAEQLMNSITQQGRESAMSSAVQCGNAALARSLVSGVTRADPGQPALCTHAGVQCRG